MKTKILTLSIAFAFLLTACNIRPDAGFTVSEVVAELGTVLSFTNISDNAVSFEWDFGDGNISTDVNPVYRYDFAGSYTVELKAFSEEDLVDRAYIDITVLPNVVLDLLVLEYYDEYEVSRAQVFVYPTWNDWLEQENLLDFGITNGQGIAIIKNNLYEGEFYLDIREANHDNYTLAGEDPDNVKTPFLYEDEINYITAYVDYYPPGMKSGRMKVVGMESGRERRPHKR